MNTKEQGFIQEALVTLELLSQGFRVANVQGDNAPYELITDWKGCLNRLQVKSTSVIESNKNNKSDTYCVSAKKSVGQKDRRIYTKADCDFIIAVIIPKHIFYVIPIEKVFSTSLRFRPDEFYLRKKSPDYEPYRNNWGLLKG